MRQSYSRDVADPMTLQPWELLDVGACVVFLTRNRAHLAPWEPRHEDAYYTEPYQVELQRRVGEERAERRGFAYAVFVDGTLAGRVALSDVVPGAFRSAHLGYFTDGSMCGRGIATGAVSQLLRLAFGELELHRVQAAVIPRNEASLRVLAKCGFQRIGLSARYLCIDGRWQDHVLFAITSEDVNGDR